MTDGTEIHARIAPLAARYEAFLCDIWGVLHNGVRAFEPAYAALSAYRREGGRVVLITNAPRPAGPVSRQLDGLGIPRAAYDAIVTSGDVTRGLVAALAGRPLFHLGPERDLSIYEGLQVELTDADRAGAVVCTGLLDDATEGPDDYKDMLAGFAARGLPFVCANPDIVVEKGTSVVYCAGALAEVYRLIGGEVRYAGKPYSPIYETAIAVLGRLAGAPVAKERVLAIGDGLKTDMAGAASFGIDAAFIPSAVHVAAGRALDSALIAELFGEAGLAPPRAALPRLAW